MAKKMRAEDCPPAARRYANEQLNGMGSTAKCPNEMRTNHGERIGTNDIPIPGQEPPDFCYDTHGTTRQGRRK